MKKYLLGLLFLTFSQTAFAAKDVGPVEVSYVYQLDSDATIFEFNAPVVHGCGSGLYRVKSPNQAVADRKFALVVTAFTARQRIHFFNTEICEGSRSVVSWIRLVQ